MQHRGMIAGTCSSRPAASARVAIPQRRQCRKLAKVQAVVAPAAQEAIQLPDASGHFGQYVSSDISVRYSHHGQL